MTLWVVGTLKLGVIAPLVNRASSRTDEERVDVSATR